jgi:RsiW-degrading membrane proteinase PrsW (M82 family)
MNASKPSKFLAILAVIVGGLLLLGGCSATAGYLGLPFVISSRNVLAAQLGQMAAIFLGLVSGGLAFWHGLASLRGKPSRPLKLPPAYLSWILFALALGLGNLLLAAHVAEAYLFPPLFLLGAALPTGAALAFAYRRLGWPLTWRQAALMLAAGSTLSIACAILLDGILPYIYYLLIKPLGYLADEFLSLFAPSGPEFLERLFFSPLLVFYFVYIAFQAPLPEEFAKALGPAFMGRRIQNERQAFAAGLASGAGFAILENMLYEGMYAHWSGWSWGGITLLRGIGAVNHSLWTAIIARALSRARARKPGWFGRILRAYLLSVLLHTLWNGGFEAFVYLTGLDYYIGLGPSLSVYGVYIEVLLVVFLAVLSAGMWWLLRRYVIQLGKEAQPDLTPALVTRRALAGWALACALVIIPIGAALGPAWKAIRAALGGQGISP